MTGEHIELSGDALSAYLDAPPLAACGRCKRKTWSPQEVGQEDRMTQPDGYPCGGRFIELDSSGARGLVWREP